MHEWLAAARDRLAELTGEAPDAFELDEDAVRQLLELARVAAHDSGDRTNAPLVCYLVGLARGRHQGKELHRIVEDLAGTTD